MRRIFKRAPRTSAAPTGPDPQLLWEWPQGCSGAPVRGGAEEPADTPRPSIVQPDGSVVPRLTHEEDLAWLALYRTARSDLFVC
jgi:hypothetical protein